MKNVSPEVDTYIAGAAPLAQPILKKVRRLFHEACPEVKEAIKWGVPHFEYKGMLGGMAAFKQHVSFGFWKGRLLADPHNLFGGDPKASMTAVKISEAGQLPADDIILDYVRRAVALNEKDIKVPQNRKSRPALETPEDLTQALQKNPPASKTFEAFSPSHRREYVEWITEAKQESTRRKRLATAIEWMSEGKPRNWKYMKKPALG